MLTSEECFARYGDPHKEKNMMVWNVPPELAKGTMPKKIYCNKDMVAPLAKAFANIIARDLLYGFHTYDGCFCIRAKRGGKSMSLHSWGVAIDINAATNRMGKKPTLVAGMAQCFKDAGFNWGGDWKGASVDGMHFELKG